jgi:hypothetical protein
MNTVRTLINVVAGKLDSVLTNQAAQNAKLDAIVKQLTEADEPVASPALSALAARAKAIAQRDTEATARLAELSNQD